MNNNETLKSKDIFYYGILGIPIAFLGFPLYIYLPNFYVEYVGLSLSIVGIILFVSRLIDMFLDPFIGKLSDTCCQRKTLIAIGSIFLLIGIYFLSNPYYHSPLWLFIFSILTYISYSLVLIPYLTLNSEISTKENNTKLSFSREIFTIIGVVIALIIPYVANVASNSKETLQLLINILLITVPIIVIIFYLNIKVAKKQKIDKKPFFKSIVSFFKNNTNNKKIFYAFLLNNLANALPATLFLFYVKYVLNLEDKTGEFLLIYFASSIFTFIFWIKLSNKIGLEYTWISSILISIVAFCFVPFLGQADYFGFLLICIFTGMCLGADMAIPTSIQSQIAQENKNMSGVLFGLWAMITKLSLSLAVLIAFVSLDYNLQSIDVSDVSNDRLIFLYSILPILLKLIAIFFIIKYKLTNKTY